MSMQNLDILIQQEKDRIANSINFTLGVFLLVPFLGSAVRAYEIGWQPIMYAQVFIVICAWIIFIFRARIPYTVRSSWIIAMLMLTAVGGVMQFGVIGRGVSWMILGPVLGTLLFNRRVGMVLALAGVAVLSLVSLYVVANAYTPDFDINQHAVSSGAWWNLVLSFGFVAILLVIVASKLNDGLTLALQVAASRNKEIESIVEGRTKELEVANRKLLKLTQEDSLTGLLNRGAFVDKLQYELERINRQKTPLSVLMLDIDFFKKINDSYGHLVGDKVLVSVAGVLTASARRLDQVGRLGGEEFGITLPGTSLEGALIIAERMRSYIEATHNHYDGQVLNLSISVGVSVATEEDTVESILGRADKALYLAKSNGRNRVEYSEK